MRIALGFVLALSTWTTIPVLASAQVPGLGGVEAVSEDTATPPDPLGRETPRGLVTGLVSALADGDAEKIRRFVETDAAGSVEDARAALDRAGEVSPSADLSLVPEGRLDDGLDAAVERIGMLRTGTKTIPLLAHRVDRDGRRIWLLSAESFETLSDWTAPAGGLANEARSWTAALPAGPTILGVPARDWALMGAFALAGYALAFGLFRLRGLVGRRIASERGPNRMSHFIAASEPPLRLALAAAIFGFGVGYLGVSVVARYQLISLVQIVFWFAGLWFAWRLIDALAEITLERMSNRGAITAYSVVTLAARVAKVLFAAIFFTFALRAFGIDITAGLAALGIGGLAFAFGAQKLVENLIGSVTLIADRPVRVGDFCRFGETLGTVEEIGIRSTKIRTLGRTIVTVPNGEFSSLHLENFTRRDVFHFHHTIGVRYETSPDQMRELLWRLRQMLLERPSVDADPARVRFISFAAYSLDVEIFAYIHAEDWNGYLEIQEAPMLDCMDIVEMCRTGFAFPSQTVYLGRDGGRTSVMAGAREAAE
ncbi:mechanosensitive ion channel family protein [Palleronia rufa]|uniref:mechanosensitive ion channel family protein n=1 Tax=Palleronia rufa TaxID=1530186 RepID=UPI0039EF5E8E